jgi:ankyrin repeat protein
MESMKLRKAMEQKSVNFEGIKFAAKGNLTGLSNWLKEGNNPNIYDEHGWTPLLKAAVRGHHQTVKLLLSNKIHPADIQMVHGLSKALPIHFAGHSGSVDTAKILLEYQPDHIDEVWDINGHTILLQAVFYGHLELAVFLLKLGADTSITTARGLGPMELARQFQNQAMMDIIRPFDTTPDTKADYYKKYLQRIAPVIPKEEMEIQKLSDRLIQIIENGILKASTDPVSAEITLQAVKKLLDDNNIDVNRRGGPLQQPPLIVTVTGNNGFPTNQPLANLRSGLAKYLLEKGADPMVHEVHPMGAQTIIRACVFNHLDILKMCSNYLTKDQLAQALNEIPLVNGLTAFHDTVLRATMADSEHFEKYLLQTEWCVENGARSDIEDFSGRTQRNIAENANNKETGKRLLEILLH